MDPGVKPPVRLDSTICDGLELLELRDIGGDGRCLTTCAAYFVDHGTKALLAAGGNDHLRASSSEAQGGFTTNATRSPNDDDNLLGDGLKVHGYPSLIRFLWPWP